MLDLTLVRVGAVEAPERGEAISDQDHVAIEIPSNIDGLPREIALKWRAETRWAFTEALKAGYFVESFVRDHNSDDIYLRKAVFTQRRKDAKKTRDFLCGFAPLRETFLSLPMTHQSLFKRRAMLKGVAVYSRGADDQSRALSFVCQLND